MSHVQDTLRMADSVPYATRWNSVVMYAALRKHLTCSFDTFLREIVGTLRDDVNSVAYAAEALELSEEKQIGLVALYLDKLEAGTDAHVSGFLGELVASVRKEREVADLRTQEEQFVQRVFAAPPPAVPAPVVPLPTASLPIGVVLTAPGGPVYAAAPSVPAQPSAPGPFAWYNPQATGAPSQAVSQPAMAQSAPVSVSALPNMVVGPPVVYGLPELPAAELARAGAPAISFPAPTAPAVQPPTAAPAEPVQIPVIDIHKVEEELPPLEERPPIVPAVDWIRPGARVRYLHGNVSHLAVVGPVNGKHADLWCDSGSMYRNVAHQYLEPVVDTPFETTWPLGSGVVKQILDLMEVGIDDGYESGELITQLVCACTASAVTGNRVDLVLDLVNGGDGKSTSLSYRMDEYLPGSTETQCVSAVEVPLPTGLTFEALAEMVADLRLAHGGLAYVLHCTPTRPEVKAEAKAKPKSSPTKPSVKKATKKPKGTK